MKSKILLGSAFLFSLPLYATNNNTEQLNHQIQQLQQQTIALQKQLNQLQKQMSYSTSAQHHSKPKTARVAESTAASKSNHVSSPNARKARGVGNVKRAKQLNHKEMKASPGYHKADVYVHSLDHDPKSVVYNPTALVAEHYIVTYIAGTPVVTAPYLGSRPSFDGSDYIVNIPSINRDVRLMQQRRKLYHAFQTMGYPGPETPIIALSGKAEPIGALHDSYSADVSSDWDLGSAELDVSAALNHVVQAYLSLAYDPSPDSFTNQRIRNSVVGMNMGFINIGDLDQTPFYFTAGQIYVPFGRFSTTMISTPLTTILGRTKSRPFILGYQSQGDNGPFAAVYGFKSDTTDETGVGGVNLGYSFKSGKFNGEFGGSIISSIDDSSGMQINGANAPYFGGFGSLLNGNEDVEPVPAIDVHGILRFDRYNFNAEWVSVTDEFKRRDLSFNGDGARPQALQLEAGATFMAFNKPSSLAVGYQWSKEALALRLPEHRISGIFNISIWKDTIESLEYRHDIDYGRDQFANGRAPVGFVNAITRGTGQTADTLLAQIGVYF